MNLKDIESKIGPIPTIEKLILNTDGSVTKILELYLDQKIQIKHINQDKKIDLDKDEIKREVLIKTDRFSLIYAKSKIYKKNLSNTFLKKLTSKNMPIGKILSEEKIESRRKINEISYKENNLKEFFKTDNPLLYRNYEILANGKILISISEFFPYLSISKKVKMPNELTQAREILDKIDQEIVIQLARRMNISEKVGEIKKSNNYKIEVINREEEILDRITQIESKLDRNFLKELFNLIFSESKFIQSKE